MRHGARSSHAGAAGLRAAAVAATFTAAAALAVTSLIPGFVGCGARVSDTLKSGMSSEQAASIRLVADDKDPKRAAFEVVGLSADELSSLAQVDWDAARWNALLAVYVAEDGEAERPPLDAPVIGDRPAVLGSHRVVDGVLRFAPQYPLRPGLAYDVVLDVSRLPQATAVDNNRESASLPLVQRFTLARQADDATAVVERVYPTANQLPENLLKFYIHFSAPMSRGEAYRRVHLLDSAGREVAFPFLELDEELWDPAGRRFTLFFDPGRIKRELDPHLQMGRALVDGRIYALVVDKDWLDATGRPLREPFRKEFHVAPPDDQPPSVDSWKITAPAAGARGPLSVTFPEPLDHALLLRQLWIENERGETVRGEVRTTNAETGWEFSPETAWPAGPYRLMVDTTLEDLAGNSIGGPFEVDVFKSVDRRVESKTVSLPFEIRAADAN